MSFPVARHFGTTPTRGPVYVSGGFTQNNIVSG